MKIAEYWEKFTSREKLLILVGIGVVCAAGIVSMFGGWDSHVAVAPVPPARSDSGFAASQPMMPQGYSVPPAGNSQLRDPFAIPPGYQGKENTADSVALTKPAASGGSHVSGSLPRSAGKGTEYTPAPKQQDALPALTGVGGAENRRVALIQYGGKTQPYEVGEMVGSGYQLLAVYDNSATLWGPNGKLVLTLGR